MPLLLGVATPTRRRMRGLVIDRGVTETGRLRSSRRRICAPSVLAAALAMALVAAPSEPAFATGARGLIPPSDDLAAVLEAFVVDGGVDYSGLAASRSRLDDFLASARDARPSEAPPRVALAFWVNLYNARVLSRVLESYGDVESVMDVEGFFTTPVFEIQGEALSLDAIEAKALAFEDPRVHFAVVCAAQSCPDLRPEPYLAARLETQLEEQTRSFLADSGKGARFDSEANVLWLSAIFKWYGGDFTGGSTVIAFLRRAKLLAWVLPYLPSTVAGEIEERTPGIRYLEYDWRLNDRGR